MQTDKRDPTEAFEKQRMEDDKQILKALKIVNLMMIAALVLFIPMIVFWPYIQKQETIQQYLDYGWPVLDISQAEKFSRVDFYYSDGTSEEVTRGGLIKIRPEREFVRCAIVIHGKPKQKGQICYTLWLPKGKPVEWKINLDCDQEGIAAILITIKCDDILCPMLQQTKLEHHLYRVKASAHKKRKPILGLV